MSHHIVFYFLILNFWQRLQQAVNLLCLQDSKPSYCSWCLAYLTHLHQCWHKGLSAQKAKLSRLGISRYCRWGIEISEVAIMTYLPGPESKFKTFHLVGRLKYKLQKSSTRMASLEYYIMHNCQMMPTVVLAKMHTFWNAVLCQVLEVQFWHSSNYKEATKRFVECQPCHDWVYLTHCWHTFIQIQDMLGWNLPSTHHGPWLEQLQAVLVETAALILISCWSKTASRSQGGNLLTMVRNFRCYNETNPPDTWPYTLKIFKDPFQALYLQVATQKDYS